MNLYEETKYILNKYQRKANKRLGQNFLIDEQVVNQIIDSAKIQKEDLVLEIGPGIGTLTKQLLEKAGKVICIELDSDMIRILEDRFSLYSNFECIHEDVLKVNLKEKIKENSAQLKHVKIVANLPYYITTPIIMKLLEERLEVETITIMIQKEVAQRLLSKPGETTAGAITYKIYYYTKPEMVCQVSKESFLPAPEVDSTVIQLKVQKEPTIQVEREDLLFKLIKVSFAQRRKTLINGLSNSGLFGEKKEIEELLKRNQLELNIRGEKLTLEEFAKLADDLAKGEGKR